MKELVVTVAIMQSFSIFLQIISWKKIAKFICQLYNAFLFNIWIIN